MHLWAPSWNFFLLILSITNSGKILHTFEPLCSRFWYIWLWLSKRLLTQKSLWLTTLALFLALHLVDLLLKGMHLWISLLMLEDLLTILRKECSKWVLVLGQVNIELSLSLFLLNIVDVRIIFKISFNSVGIYELSITWDFRGWLFVTDYIDRIALDELLI